MEDLNKDQLHEAYHLAKSLGNAFRAFKHAEESILQIDQLKSAFDTYVSQTDQAKKDAGAALAELAGLVAKQDVARAELDQEVVRLAEYRKGELAKVNASLAASREVADAEIRKMQGEISSIEADLVTRRTTHSEQLASLDRELAAKDAVLTDLQAHIDALKQKFA